MKKSVSAMLITISVLVFVVLVNLLFNKPPETLNEEYINSWVIAGEESIDKILFTSEGEEYTACLCSVSDEEILFLVVENNKTFDMHFRQTFTVNTLTEESQKIMSDGLFSDENIIYNIFLNPDVNTVTVNNVEHTVNTFKYNEHTIGFWWSEVN